MLASSHGGHYDHEVAVVRCTAEEVWGYSGEMSLRKRARGEYVENEPGLCVCVCVCVCYIENLVKTGAYQDPIGLLLYIHVTVELRSLKMPKK